MPHWTLHLSISHSPAVPLPATCCGDSSQIPHCENHMTMRIMTVAPFLKKEKISHDKSYFPVTKAGALCLPSGLCPRSTGCRRHAAARQFLNRSPNNCFMTSQQFYFWSPPRSQSAVFSGNLLYQKYNFHASKNWRKVGAVRNASILCL